MIASIPGENRTKDLQFKSLDGYSNVLGPSIVLDATP
jgi:hypothetical protein